MKVQFQLGEVALEKNEAHTIHEISGADEVLTVDLFDHIDTSQINTDALFTMSIEKRDPALAALAAKLAITGVKFSKKRAYNKNGAKTIAQVETVKTDPFDALGQILNSNTLRSVGAAMILNSLADGERRSLREIAEDVVNHMHDYGFLNTEESPGFFKGFYQKRKGWFANIDRQSPNQTYHTSPMYTAMREGLSFLKSVGLVDLEEDMSFGALNKKLSGSQTHLRRRVYTVALNDAGVSLMDTWADSDAYIANFWTTR